MLTDLYIQMSLMTSQLSVFSGFLQLRKRHLKRWTWKFFGASYFETALVMFCLYTLPLARPAQAKVQMITSVKSIPWNLVNLSHLYYLQFRCSCHVHNWLWFLLMQDILYCSFLTHVHHKKICLGYSPWHEMYVQCTNVHCDSKWKKKILTIIWAWSKIFVYVHKRAGPVCADL